MSRSRCINGTFAGVLSHGIGENGGMYRAALKTLLDDGLSLVEIGRRVGRHESTVAYWVDKHRLRA